MKYTKNIIKPIILLCLGMLFCTCKTPNKQQKDQIYYLNAIRILAQGPEYYLFSSGNELYSTIDNWGNWSNIDSLCLNTGLEVDTIKKIKVYGNLSFFDTIYYANYSFETIIFDRISICLTEDECFVHACNRADQVNVHFSLSDLEIAILNSLVLYCGLDKSCTNNIESYLDDNMEINMRIRIINKGRYYDLLLSDASKKHKEIALLNSYIIGLSNKYVSLYSERGEIPTFLLPVHCIDEQ